MRLSSQEVFLAFVALLFLVERGMAYRQRHPNGYTTSSQVNRRQTPSRTRNLFEVLQIKIQKEKLSEKKDKKTSYPSANPSNRPSSPPSFRPSPSPSSPPSGAPSMTPTGSPQPTITSKPSSAPSSTPSSAPSALPTSVPSSKPSSVPSWGPSSMPSIVPSFEPSASPSHSPSAEPSGAPSSAPSLFPTVVMSVSPSAPPSSTPSAEPTTTYKPSLAPSVTRSGMPSTSFKPSDSTFVVSRSADADGNEVLESRCEENIPVESSGVADQLFEFTYNMYLSAEADPALKTSDVERRLHPLLSWHYMDCDYAVSDADSDPFEVRAIFSTPVDQLAASCEAKDGARCFTVKAAFTAEIFYILGVNRRLNDVISDSNLVESFADFLDNEFAGDALNDGDPEIVSLDFTGFSNIDGGGTGTSDGIDPPGVDGVSGFVGGQPAEGGSRKIMLSAALIGCAVVAMVIVGSLAVGKRQPKRSKRSYGELLEESFETDTMTLMASPRSTKSSPPRPERSDSSRAPRGKARQSHEIAYILNDLDDDESQEVASNGLPIEVNSWSPSLARPDGASHKSVTTYPQFTPATRKGSRLGGPRSRQEGNVFVTSDTVNL